MKNQNNIEAQRAYRIISGEKNKFGSYRKTLFHVHTPESHDYRLFRKWKELSESDWNDLTIDDYMKEVKKQEIFPNEFFQTDKGDRVLYENYDTYGFNSEKEKISFLTLAQSLYNENISVVVVSDHNTISGIKKLKTAIKLVSELFQNKHKEYIEVINGVEISCADRVHVLIAFPDNKFKSIHDWLDYNLMSIKEGSFKSSLEILDTFIHRGCLAYIAHINSSDVFKEGHFSIAYKKKLFSIAYTKFIGVSDPEKITSVNSYLTKFLKKNAPSFILDNDSHCIEEHSINPMWIKFSKRNYDQLREALSEYNVSIELMNPEIKRVKAIRGIYIPTLENSYLQRNNSYFVMKFSESLNCLIGGRGTGKSTILDLIQFVLSQKADTKQKFEFLSRHSRVYILYEISKKEYLVELNLPTQKNGEDIYETFGVKTKSTSSYWYYESRLKEKIREQYLSIYEVQENEQLNKVTKKKKYDLIDQMFDNRYSVNQLVNIASDDRISDYLFEVISKGNDFKKYRISNKISSKDKIDSFVMNETQKLEKQRNRILSLVNPFNDTQSGKLKIIYSQHKDFILPEKFYTWFFPEGKNLDNPFRGYRLTNGEIIDYFSMIFERKGFMTFVNLMNNRNLNAEDSIKKFSQNSTLHNDIYLKEVDNILLNEIYELWDKVNISLVQLYLEDVYSNCEKLSLEFNINSKVTDGNKKTIFKEVVNLSLGQKVVAMLDFILAYSEFTNDKRPLLIDQPEDNLDSRYIYNNLVQILRDVKNKRQIIVATHNATIVTNAMSDLVILMESDGEHGWVEQCGYPSEDIIKKHIVNYLEGGQESFEHKVKIYKRVIDLNKS
ncbi:Spaf_1101 family AAA-like ATPase [Streptococcus constellatus]|uniref:Spaf_1101 family AAA-like ATPase n=1 Tax=Streptococcus constellatus TaxID=76860 RepID=UPI001897D6A9|nr:AAA family ATPase [Streptococcus constellatus]